MIYGYGRVSTKGQAKDGTVWKHRNGCLRNMEQRLFIWILLLVRR